MRRRVLFGIAGWLAALVAATAVGIAAIGVLEDGITGSRAQTLDGDGVRRSLSSPAASQEASPGTSTRTPRGDEITRVLRTNGGTVTVTCARRQASLDAWSPEQGFGAEDEVRGPARQVSLKFESDEAEYLVAVTCGAQGPVATTYKDDGHRRRGRDGH